MGVTVGEHRRPLVLQLGIYVLLGLFGRGKICAINVISALIGVADTVTPIVPMTGCTLSRWLSAALIPKAWLLAHLRFRPPGE